MVSSSWWVMVEEEGEVLVCRAQCSAAWHMVLAISPPVNWNLYMTKSLVMGLHTTMIKWSLFTRDKGQVVPYTSLYKGQVVPYTSLYKGQVVPYTSLYKGQVVYEVGLQRVLVRSTVAGTKYVTNRKTIRRGPSPFCQLLMVDVT